MSSMRGAPLVSIIVPVFNGEQFLRESLDSIVAQTYPQTEVLVMDDASTDGTQPIVKSYGDYVRYYRQSITRGIYGNTNDGIGMARGEHIAVYHADDLYHPGIVEREVAFLREHPSAGAVFCQDVFMDLRGVEVGRLELPPEVRGGRPLEFPAIFNALLKYKNRILRCPSSMVRTSVYRDVGRYRDQEFRNTSDLEMWLRIARKYPIGILEEYLLWYRHGHGSSAQRYHHLRTEPERYFQIMDLYLSAGGLAVATAEALTAYEAHRAEDHLTCAVNHYIRAERAKARAALRRVRADRILGSPEVQRWRLLCLFLVLQGLSRIPRSAVVAGLLYQRRYGTLKPGMGRPRLPLALRRGVGAAKHPLV